MPQMQELSYYISFGEAQERYEIKQSALSYRIKALGIKTKRQGRKTLLTVNQLSILDDLHEFLKENNGRTIDEFLALKQNQEIFDTVLNPEKVESLQTEIKNSQNASLINHCITDESLMNPDKPDWESHITLISKAITRLEGLVIATNESLINDTDRRQYLENDSRIIELEERINQLNENLDKANQRYDLLLETNKELLQLSKHIFKTSSDRENENTRLKKFCKTLMPFEKANLFDNLIRIDNSVYFKTAYNDFDLFAYAFCKWM